MAQYHRYLCINPRLTLQIAVLASSGGLILEINLGAETEGFA